MKTVPLTVAHEDGNRHDRTTHTQLTNIWHWRWKRSIQKACKRFPAWAHPLHSSTVWLRLANREMDALADHSKCFTHPWGWKEARGQEQYKVKAIHNLEWLLPLSHCCTVMRSQMTTRRVAVNTNYLQVQGRWVIFPKLSWFYAVAVTHAFSRHAFSRKLDLEFSTYSCSVIYA